MVGIGIEVLLSYIRINVTPPVLVCKKIYFRFYFSHPAGYIIRDVSENK